MKLIPTTKDSLALTVITLMTLVLFICGLFDVLNFFIVKAVLFLGFVSLLVAATYYAIKNSNTKNRLEDKPQDDSH